MAMLRLNATKKRSASATNDAAAGIAATSTTNITPHNPRNAHPQYHGHTDHRKKWVLTAHHRKKQPNKHAKTNKQSNSNKAKEGNKNKETLARRKESDRKKEQHKAGQPQYTSNKGNSKNSQANEC